MAMSRYASEREATGQRVYHLEVGQPSTSAPAAVRKAAAAALESDRLGYTNALGIPELRDRLGTSRKFLIPMLEYFDAQGLTIRQGGHRVLKR